MKSSWKTKTLSVVLAGLGLWFLVLAVGAQLRYNSGQRQLNAMDDRINGAVRENERLAKELELMKRPDWLALLARARLNYKRPGETVVFVYKNEKAGTISQPHPVQDERPNWRKWLDWVKGR